MIVNLNNFIPKVPGVYMLIDLENNKKWIGESSNLRNRAFGHENKLKSNVSSRLIQQAWNDGHNFLFVVLEANEYLEKEKRLELEKYYTLHFKTNEFEYGYNLYTARDLSEEVRKSNADRLKIIRKNVRSRKGEEIHTSVLTEDDVYKIVSRIKNREDVKEIAKDYNVKPGAISKIKNGYTWKHITGGKIIP